MKLFKVSTLFIIFFMIFLQGCKSDIELTMERGNYFYLNGDFSEASLEFKKIILQHSNKNDLDIKQIEILAHAYQQLALSQAQLGDQADSIKERIIDYKNALENSKKAESLAIKEGKRSEYRKTRLGIENKLKLIQ